MAHDELELVEWLHRQQPCDPRVALGIGDDMAVIAPQEGFMLVASDMLLDGVHFDSARDDLAAIGRKALACNLSDCAAMAVRPLAATVSVALPRGMVLEKVKEFFRGMFALAKEFEVAIVGGDTTRWDHPLVIDVAITATTYAGIDPVTRFRARPGDRVLVTGKLGGSLKSGRHLRFVPRVREAKQIAEALGVHLHAMMDISDGLSLDLWRMCQASGVGAALSERELQQVVHEDVPPGGTAHRDGDPFECRSAVERAISDGEDFELLLTVDAQADFSRLGLHPVGDIVADGYAMRRGDGTVVDIQPRGYVH